MPKRLFLDPRDAIGFAQMIQELLESDEIKNADSAQTIEAIAELLSKPMYLEDDTSTRVQEPLSQQEIANKLGLPENPPPGYTSERGDPNPVTEEMTIEELQQRRKAIEEAN